MFQCNAPQLATPGAITPTVALMPSRLPEILDVHALLRGAAKAGGRHLRHPRRFTILAPPLE